MIRFLAKGENRNKANRILNVAILIGVIGLIALISAKYFFRDSETFLKVSEKLQISDIKWDEYDKNLVLVLNKDCVFCKESGEFYKKLYDTTKDSDVRMIAILPSEPKESDVFLESMGLSGVMVLRAEPKSIKVGGTPTILLVDKSGKVLKIWIGKLNQTQEAEVYEIL